jgi:hypothetical protein
MTVPDLAVIDGRNPRLLVEIRSRLGELREPQLVVLTGSRRSDKATARGVVALTYALETIARMHYHEEGTDEVYWVTCELCDTESACPTLRQVAVGVGIRVL